MPPGERLLEVQALAPASVSGAVMVTDPDGVIVWINDAFTNLSGYAADEAVGATSRLLASGEQDEPGDRRLWDTIVAGRRGQAEVVERRKDGSRYRAIQTITPLLDGAGVPSYLVVVYERPTPLGATQARRQAAERFQAQLLDAAGEAVIATDLDDTVVYWNPAAERLYGWGRHEALGRDIAELGLAQPARDQAAEIAARARSGETWIGREDARRADGTLVPVWLAAAPFFDTDGHLAGIIGVSSDVSELEAARSGLAERVRQLAVVADLGQYALDSDDPRVLAVEAERRVDDLLGPSLRAQVCWSPQPGVGAITEEGVLLQVPIAAAGVLCVIRVEDEARLEDDDEEFLRAVANLISAAVRHQEATRELEHQAAHDQLTGLPNRTLFTDRLGLARAAASRTGGGYLVLFLDLDEFKTINDSLGHDAGDEILQITAARLQGVLRPTDTVGRFGGDEFAILCPDLDTRPAGAEVARRVQQALTAPFDTSHGQLTVTASIGIVFGDAAAVPTELLRDVDAAMYAAKDRGRNRIEYFDTRLHELANQRLKTTAHLRDAIAGDGVVVHYQPSIELATGRLIGVEALVRLRQLDGSLLSPDAFIGLAEDAGLIGALGQRVLEITCADAAGWLAVDPDFMVAVNLSAHQFTDPRLADTIVGTLQAAGVPAANLWLEITESALLTGPHVRTAIHTLGRLGVRFAIDDFGTGYSSLAHLRDTPVDALKIDRGFVAGLLDDPRDRALVVATLDLARTFGLLTTAEGIESHEQRRELTDLGCRYAQGYLWSPPVAAEHLTAMLVRGITPDPDECTTETTRRTAPDALGSQEVNGARRTASAVGLAGTPPTRHRVWPGGAAHDPDLKALTSVDAIVTSSTRELLHAESAAEVRDILLAAVDRLGGSTVVADQADVTALPVDLTLGGGAPLLPTAEPDSVARRHLERYLPGLAADARQALDALARTERLSRQATTDHLTQLGNRATFARLLSRLGRSDLIVALDLDGFKAANDTHGHSAGDDVLREFAACLREHLRANDHAVRLGGDEFALVLTGTGVEGGLVMLDRLRAAWEERRSHPVDFSAGLAPCLTSPAQTRERADNALYAAKSAGRGQTIVADPPGSRVPSEPEAR